MAVCQTEQWAGSYTPYVKLTVTESSSTATESVLSYTLQYIAASAAQTGDARAYSIKIAGTTVKEGTFQINGKTGTHTIATGTKTIAKTTSAQNVTFSVSFNFNVTWSGSYGGTKTASGSISVPAKTSYKVSYDANGGSGAPSAQTKWHGTILVLSSAKPTRTGYSFQGWATSSGGSVVYSVGDSYTANSSATLYAVWKANTYTISYNANGGSGAPSAQTKTYGVTLTLSSTKPTRTNYTFKGWSTSSNGGVVYSSGASYTNNSSVTLYAVWAIAYRKPRIDNFTVNRCNSSGTLNNNGTYAKVTFSWSTDKTVTSVKIEWKSQKNSTWSSAIVSASGTSGSVNQTIGNGELDTETSYSVRVYVSDSGGTTPSSVLSIGTISYPIDIKKGGTGVAIGKVAEKDAFEVNMDMYIKNKDIRDYMGVLRHTVYSTLSQSDSVYYIRLNSLELGGIYQVAIVYNHNTSGSPYYRSVVYGILSIPCGYDNSTSKIVVRPKFNIISDYRSTDSGADPNLKVVCEGGGTSIAIESFNSVPTVYIYITNTANIEILKVNILKVSM